MGPWLAECIDSLEAQSMRHFEVLAVNDRSADDTGSILAAWAARDHRVRHLEVSRARRRETGPGNAEPNGGLVEALSLAASKATAPLLARMDGDDVAHPHRFERQCDFMDSRADLAACGSAVELFPRSALGDGYRRYEGWLNGLQAPESLERDLFVECPIAHPAMVIRRSVLQGLGGYRDPGWPEDYDLVLRLYSAGMRAANLPHELIRWRVRPDRHSLTSPRYDPAAFRRCKVHFLAHAFLPSARALVIWGAGMVGKPLARELIAQGLEVAAFVDLDPRKIGQEIHGAPVLDPAGFAAMTRREDPYVLAAVGSPGAREEIRAALGDIGLREIDDYRVCA
jgi:glycosyltransferase involved in cell wall biosynthesis